MNGEAREAFEQYAERRAARGPESVYEQAAGSSQLRYYTSAPTTHRHYRWVADAAAIVMLIGIVTLSLSRRTPVMETPPAAAPPPTAAPGLHTPSPAEEANFRAQMEENLKRGWMTIVINSKQPGLPELGWVPLAGAGNDGQAPLPFPKGEQDSKGNDRTPIYDNPNGSILGYDYPNLGFFKKEDADKPDFDAGELYRGQNKCKPKDQACLAERMDAAARTQR